MDTNDATCVEMTPPAPAKKKQLKRKSPSAATPKNAEGGSAKRGKKTKKRIEEEVVEQPTRLTGKEVIVTIFRYG